MSGWEFLCPGFILVAARMSQAADGEGWPALVDARARPFAAQDPSVAPGLIWLLDFMYTCL